MMSIDAACVHPQRARLSRGLFLRLSISISICMYIVAAMLNIDTGNWGLLAKTTKHHQTVTVTHLSSTVQYAVSQDYGSIRHTATL